MTDISLKKKDGTFYIIPMYSKYSIYSTSNREWIQVNPILYDMFDDVQERVPMEVEPDKRFDKYVLRKLKKYSKIKNYKKI